MTVKRNFLVIEESDALRKVWGLRLGKLDAEIFEAKSATEARQCLADQTIDLIVSGAALADMGGRDFCREVKKNPDFRKTPFILLSPYQRPGDQEEALEAGANAIITHAIEGEELATTVENVLAAAEGNQKSRILIVDDSITILRLVEASLNQSGFQVFTAKNGIEGLEMLQLAKPDLIISDLDMPIMNGMEFCQKLADNPLAKGVPFMIMSANSEKRVMREMISQGASAYMVKPFNMEQFLITVEKLMSEQFRMLDSERKRLELERGSMLSTITALVTALEARDPYTHGHSARVSEYSIAIGKEMNLDAKTLEILEIAGKLHDVGKIGISDLLLLKPGKLTDEEVKTFNAHPSIGASILTPIPSLEEMVPIVELHHEHFDGLGYPKGLKGEDIPLMARICAVADCYDALTSDRPYRKGFPKNKALNIISEVRGTQLCPEAVDAFFLWAEQDTATGNT